MREGESVELANRRPYGLAASLRANDHPRAQRTTAEPDFGAVRGNPHGTPTPEATYGGFKHSGHGKDLFAHALSTTVTPRTRHYDAGPDCSAVQEIR
ncbi:aldehyde dehydrogenase family protein [Streptomyces sp. NPDC007901]|uniref:aldehyde dehydrogenase family protein n=1 Tax=Streptomyces sp. NPDC007901 TaxID=3364785 RepID=UPI0036E6204F